MLVSISSMFGAISVQQFYNNAPILQMRYKEQPQAMDQVRGRPTSGCNRCLSMGILEIVNPSFR